MGRLDNKVGLVTGSAHSIGKAIAIGLAKEGANMVLADLDYEGVQQTAKEIEALGRKALPVKVNVLEADQITALFAKAVEVMGSVDVLVNCAGVFNGGPLDELTPATVDLVLGTNLRAPFLCTMAVWPIMKKQGGGRIVNIGSISAQRPRANSAPYSTAKSGLVGLTTATALDGREFGITCGILHPGETDRDRAPQLPPGMTPPPGGFPKMPPEKSMATDDLAAAAIYMCTLPPTVNVLSMIQLPIEQPYLGRG